MDEQKEKFEKNREEAPLAGQMIMPGLEDKPPATGGKEADVGSASASNHTRMLGIDSRVMVAGMAVVIVLLVGIIMGMFLGRTDRGQSKGEEDSTSADISDTAQGITSGEEESAPPPDVDEEDPNAEGEESVGEPFQYPTGEVEVAVPFWMLEERNNASSGEGDTSAPPDADYDDDYDYGGYDYSSDPQYVVDTVVYGLPSTGEMWKEPMPTKDNVLFKGVQATKKSEEYKEPSGTSLHGKRFYCGNTVVEMFGYPRDPKISKDDLLGVEGLYNYITRVLNKPASWPLFAIIPFNYNCIGVMGDYEAIICKPLWEHGPDAYLFTHIKGNALEAETYRHLLYYFDIYYEEDGRYFPTIPDYSRANRLTINESHTLISNVSAIFGFGNGKHFSNEGLEFITRNGVVLPKPSSKFGGDAVPSVDSKMLPLKPEQYLSYQRYECNNCEVIVSCVPIADYDFQNVGSMWEHVHPDMISRGVPTTTYLHSPTFSVVRSSPGESGLFEEYDKPGYVEAISKRGLYYQSVAIQFNFSDKKAYAEVNKLFNYYGVQLDSEKIVTSDTW